MPKTGFIFVDCFLGRHLKAPGFVVVVPVSLKFFLGKIAKCNGMFVPARAIVEERIAMAPRTLAGGGYPTRGEMNPEIPGMLANQLSCKKGGLPPELLTVNTTSHFSDDGKLVCALLMALHNMSLICL